MASPRPIPGVSLCALVALTACSGADAEIELNSVSHEQARAALEARIAELGLNSLPAGAGVRVGYYTEGPNSRYVPLPGASKKDIVLSSRFARDGGPGDIAAALKRAREFSRWNGLESTETSLTLYASQANPDDDQWWFDVTLETNPDGSIDIVTVTEGYDARYWSRTTAVVRITP